MSKHFERDMQVIDDHVFALFGIVEKMIDDSVRALCERQDELVQSVIETDDIVDQREVLIEEECLKALALHQPVAGSLRRLTTLIKINSMLERIADLACNIAKRAEAISEYPFFPIPDRLPNMGQDAMQMVRMALDSFVDLDTQLAQDVIARDQVVDEAHLEVISELEDLMASDTSQIRPGLQCFSVSRYLERIADLAENIAKDVIYLVKGEVIRHQNSDPIQEI